jgi:peptidoglycan/xylan/chitin deacetylase (PgdA/CDA1 family)
MQAISILYHDVVSEADADRSGFPGADANIYKLERSDFEAHLRAIDRAFGRKPVSVESFQETARDGQSLLLTFDDGGESAYPLVAELLAERSWIGHFFITAGYVGQPGFVTKQDIRELRARGHVIGSHSFTHPSRMSACSEREIYEEWERSIKFLSDVIGEPVHAASVPGGYFSNRVARAATKAGIKYLFISEPTSDYHTEQGCLIFGRYTIWRGMAAEIAAEIAVGRRVPRWKQWVWWNTKKVAKMVGGDSYVKIRKSLLRNS